MAGGSDPGRNHERNRILICIEEANQVYRKMTKWLWLTYIGTVLWAAPLLAWTMYLTWENQDSGWVGFYGILTLFNLYNLIKLGKSIEVFQHCRRVVLEARGQMEKQLSD